MIAQNKGAFFYLIHLKFDKKSKKNSVRSEFEDMDFDSTSFQELFGQKMNKRNLRQFFSMPAMQYVWNEYYRNHPTYKNLKAKALS